MKNRFMNNIEQSKKETAKSSFKRVVEETRKSKHGFSNQLLWFVVFTILSLSLAYLTPFSLILTVPLVIVPSFFSFMSVNAIKGAKNSEGVTFLRMYKNYFSQLFFGGYRLIIGFLKSLAAYAVSGSLMISIYLNTKAEYREIFAAALNQEDLNKVNEDLMAFLTKPELQKELYLFTAIALLLAAFFFMNHLFKNSIKMRRNLFSISPIPMRQFSMVDGKVRKKNRRFLHQNYFSCLWFIQLLVIIAGAGGIVFAYFFLKEFDPFKAVTISLFLIVLVMTPFLNYISTFEDLLYLNLMGQYEEVFVTMTLEFLTKYKDKIGIEEEEAKKIQDMLEHQKKAMDESNKKEDDKEEK